MGSLGDLVGSMGGAYFLTWRRLTTFRLTFIITGLSSLGFIFIVVPQECAENNKKFCWEKIILLLFSFIIRAAMNLNYSIIHVYDVEVFPTWFRGTATGIVDFCGKMGSMLAPFLANYFIY